MWDRVEIIERLRDSARITVRNFISRENKADHVDGLMKHFIEFNFNFLFAPIVGD